MPKEAPAARTPEACHASLLNTTTYCIHPHVYLTFTTSCRMSSSWATTSVPWLTCPSVKSPKSGGSASHLQAWAQCACTLLTYFKTLPRLDVCMIPHLQAHHVIRQPQLIAACRKFKEWCIGMGLFSVGNVLNFVSFGEYC